MRAIKVEVTLAEETKEKVEEIAQSLHLEFEEALRDLILLGTEIKERQLEETSLC